MTNTPLWLLGKSVRFVGEHPAAAQAITQAGATLVSDRQADLLVYVAQPTPARPIQETDHAAWRAAMDHQLDQCFFEANAYAAHCREQQIPGSMLFITHPQKAHGVEHATATGALINLIKSLSVEWARDGMRVNGLLTQSSSDTMGHMTAFLLSDYAAYISGAIMGITPEEQI